MSKEMLKGLGLTETQIKIYLALLKTRNSLASEISKRAKVERSLTYHSLEVLIQKGLAGYFIKENRKYFHAADPQKLLDIFKERQRELEQQEKDLTKFVASLESIKAAKMSSLNVEVYRGKEGFKTVMNDLLKESEDYFIIGYTAKSTDIAKFWYSHWNSRRVKAKIKRFLLIPTSVEQKAALKFPLTQVRHLPKKYTAPAKASTIIYGIDKTLVFLPLGGDFVGVMIKNKDVHNSYRDFFDMLWMQAQEV